MSGASPGFPDAPAKRSRGRDIKAGVVILTAVRSHWPEYAIEASCLALFMLSAAAAATVLQHPASPWMLETMPAFVARLPMGAAMGLTAVAIIYSPFGRRSGAHMNPAVTLTFLRLGKITPADALFYVLAQFAGGVAGIAGATWLLRGLPGDPSVNYLVTEPGPDGPAMAFAAEFLISFGLMTVILHATNHARLAPFTGLFAGGLVMAYITIEAPLSGMSMNPARSFGPALLAGSFHALWIYLAAPLAGMLGAAELFIHRRGLAGVLCAKLHHSTGPCHFQCRFASREAASARTTAVTIDEVPA
jgi:aquaporin Z